mgnify:FL=1
MYISHTFRETAHIPTVIQILETNESSSNSNQQR